MFHGLSGQIAQEFAEGFGAVERVAAEKFFDLFELLRFLSHGDHRGGL